MANPMARPFTLVAVDTNFLLDLVVPRDKAHEVVEVFRRRVPGVEFVVVPTVIDELDYMTQYGDSLAIVRWPPRPCKSSFACGSSAHWILVRSSMGLSRRLRASCVGKN